MSEFVKLGTLTHIRTGKLDANASVEDGQYPFFTCSKEPLRIASYSYDCECVLVAGNGDLNVKYYKGKFDAYQRTYIIESIDKSKLLVKYLYFFLYIYVEVLRTQSIGGVIKYIKLGNLTDALIPLPSIEKQAKIVAEFEKCDTLIDSRLRQLAMIDQLVKSRFIELFGDPETNPKGWIRQRLDQVCENLDSRRVPITSTDRKAGNYPYYGASGIVDYVEDYIFDEDILLISEDGANLVMRSTPIAFSVSGKVWVNNHAHVVRFESKATQKYIEICFALTDISGSITGTAQPKLNQAKLNAMMFCVPPIELQEQFAAFVEQTDKSKYYSSLSFRYCQAAANTYRQEWMTCRTSDF